MIWGSLPGKHTSKVCYLIPQYSYTKSLRLATILIQLGLKVLANSLRVIRNPRDPPGLLVCLRFKRKWQTYNGTYRASMLNANIATWIWPRKRVIPRKNWICPAYMSSLHFCSLATLASSNFSLYGQTSALFPVTSVITFWTVKYGFLNFIRPYSCIHIRLDEHLTRLVNHNADRESLNRPCQRWSVKKEGK